MATANWYGLGAYGQWSTVAARRVDWTGDTIKVLLTYASYTPNQDTHAFQSDITSEVQGGSYTQQTLANKSVTYTGGTNAVALDADDAAWTSVTLDARYAVVFKDTGVTAANPVLGYVDFGSTQSITSGNFTITWAADGVLKGVAA